MSHWTSNHWLTDSNGDSGGTAPGSSPSFLPAEQSFQGCIAIHLIAVDGDVLFYTTDGSDPIPFSAREYTSPIILTGTATIKAVAVGSGRTSDVVSATYILAKDSVKVRKQFDPYQ